MFDWLRRMLVPYERDRFVVWKDIPQDELLKYDLREEPYLLLDGWRSRYCCEFITRRCSDKRKKMRICLDMFSDYKSRSLSPIVTIR